MQVEDFILFYFCCLFGVFTTGFIYTVIAKEIVFTCVIYTAILYHQNERDIPSFCVT